MISNSERSALQPANFCDMVAVDEEGQRFIPGAVWKATVRRAVANATSRLDAHAGRTQLKVTRSGQANQRQIDSCVSQVQPLNVGYNEDGTQMASEPWTQTLHAP